MDVFYAVMQVLWWLLALMTVSVVAANVSKYIEAVSSKNKLSDKMWELEEVVSVYVRAAEQLMDNNDEKLAYVLSEMRRQYSNMDEGLLRAWVEASVYGVSRSRVRS